MSQFSTVLNPTEETKFLSGCENSISPPLPSPSKMEDKKEKTMEFHRAIELISTGCKVNPEIFAGISIKDKCPVCREHSFLITEVSCQKGQLLRTCKKSHTWYFETNGDVIIGKADIDCD